MTILIETDNHNLGMMKMTTDLNTTTPTTPKTNNKILSATLAFGQPTAIVCDIMESYSEKPMHVVSEIIARELSISTSYARAWYRDMVRRGKAPGEIAKKPTKAELKALRAKRKAMKAVVTAPEASAEAGEAAAA